VKTLYLTAQTQTQKKPGSKAMTQTYVVLRNSWSWLINGRAKPRRALRAGRATRQTSVRAGMSGSY